MDLRLATLKAVSFYLLHNVSTLNQCRAVSCVQLCVNTLPASNVTLISHECISVLSLESVSRSSVLHLVNGMLGRVIKLIFSNTQLAKGC